jgi:hypothetical protein
LIGADAELIVKRSRVMIAQTTLPDRAGIVASDGAKVFGVQRELSVRASHKAELFLLRLPLHMRFAVAWEG